MPVNKGMHKSKKSLTPLFMFGCERFHHFVYGRTINIESYHKPLESIMKKLLWSAPPCLQRMLLCLQKYMLAMYKPGKSIPVADALSKKYLNETENTSELMEAHVHLMVSSFQSPIRS